MREIYRKMPTDRWDVMDRSVLWERDILPALYGGSGGLFNPSDILEAGTVLDIACGRGALGLAARRMGARARFVGVDGYDYANNPVTPTGYDEYEAVWVGKAESTKMMRWIGGWRYDLVMAACTALDVYRFLARNHQAIPVSPSGKIVLVAEMSLDECEQYGFDLRVGRGLHYSMAIRRY